MLSAMVDKVMVDKIKKVVIGALKRDFDNVKNVRIVNVFVDSNRDRDGDRVLQIMVVLEGTPKAQDVRTMSGAVRQIRPGLAKIGEDAFPLISFISKSDAEEARLGAS